MREHSTKDTLATIKKFEEKYHKEKQERDIKFIEDRCKELYDFTKPHRKLGYIQYTTCKNCNIEISYLFVPSKLCGKCISKGISGSKLHIIMYFEDAKVISDGDCPNCGKSLYYQLQEEAQARVLR